MKNLPSLFFMIIGGFLPSASSFAQSNALFNPDYNGDGFIGVEDILGSLSFFDNIWEGPIALSCSCGGTVFFHGVEYSTTQIGGQCWFTQNLRSSTYLNGDTIPQNLSDEDWSSTMVGAMTFYNNDLTAQIAYGALYNWYAVDDPRGLCPNGWHVPSDSDWTNLSDFLGGEAIAGSQMKATFGWPMNGNGTNSSGFTGLPGGYRGNNGWYAFDGIYGIWWSTTPNNLQQAWGRTLTNETDDLFRYANHGKSSGFSIRCLRDLE